MIITEVVKLIDGGAHGAFEINLNKSEYNISLNYRNDLKWYAIKTELIVDKPLNNYIFNSIVIGLRIIFPVKRKDIRP